MAGQSDSDTIDAGMLELFRSEVDQHTQSLTDGLLALERDPSQLDLVEGLMRAAHSIKGAARIVGVGPAVGVAHAMEDCLVAAQEGKLRLTAEGVDALLRGVDLLVQIAKAAGGPLGEWEAAHAADIKQFQADLAAVRAGRAPAAPAKTRGADAPRSPETLAAPADLNDAAAETLRQSFAGRPGVRLDLSAVADVSPAGLTLLAALARGGTEMSGAGPELASLVRAAGGRP